ncbi:MAG: SIS domain-containing protein [Candidatus Competibacteraceae bacterium]|nr:SIS domain-containing protein [Candidatus Competibacteraceae bacterium]
MNDFKEFKNDVACSPDSALQEQPLIPLLAQIDAARGRLSRAEQRVADYVLSHADDIMHQSIAALASSVGVSQPTVARFCLALGFTGFKEFKLRLVQSLAGGVPFVHRDVGVGDPVSALVAKVLDRTISALMRVRNDLDAEALDQAVHLLANARRIEFYGAGNSGIIAADAQHKFFRLGAPTVAYADAHIYGMAATLLQPGDVVVAISNTGRTRDVLRGVELALQAGASVVAITASGSPLARLSTVALCADVEEDPDTYSPMTSRIAHLAIIDVLAVGVALDRGPELLPQLEKAKQSLRERRVPRHKASLPRNDKTTDAGTRINPRLNL